MFCLKYKRKKLSKTVFKTYFNLFYFLLILYVSSGSIADWTYGAAKIKYSYAVELRDTGEYGYFLPPDQIIPSGKKTSKALIALANLVVNN